MNNEAVRRADRCDENARNGVAALVGLCAIGGVFVVPVVAGLVAWQFFASVIAGLVTAAITGVFFLVYAIPITLQLSAQVMHFDPRRRAWGGMPAVPRINASRKPGLMALLCPCPTVAIVVGAVAGLAILAIWNPSSKWWAFGFLCVGATVLRFSLLILGSLPNRLEIVVLRRFDDAAADDTRKGLLPWLWGCGNVTTLGDAGLEKARSNQYKFDDAASFTDPELCEVVDEGWREAVKSLVAKSDLILIDVSVPKGGVGWELTQCCGEWGCCDRVVLVASMRRMFDRIESLRQELLQVMPGDRASNEALLDRLGGPLPYVDNAASMLFAWRLWRLLRSCPPSGVQLQGSLQ